MPLRGNFATVKVVHAGAGVFDLDVSRAVLKDGSPAMSFSSPPGSPLFNVSFFEMSNYLYVSTTGGFPTDGSSGVVTVDEAKDRIDWQAPPHADGGNHHNSVGSDILYAWFDSKRMKREWMVTKDAFFRNAYAPAPKVTFLVEGQVKLTADAELFATDVVANPSAPLPDELNLVAATTMASDAKAGHVVAPVVVTRL